MPPPRKQTPLSYPVPLPSPWTLLVGRLAPLERPTGRRLVSTLWANGSVRDLALN